ncbi:DnaJ domain-containing protein [Scenedesmus sp. NREL 46B-D3]|nr:DnaJ domain-containing protein [Scenedesmus sp. NREL 46B-D3]
MDDFFSGGAAAPSSSNSSSKPAQQQQQRPQVSVGSSSMSKSHSSSDGQLADLLSGGGPAGAAARGPAPAKSSSMTNLGGLEGLSLDAVDAGRHGDLYADPTTGAAVAGGDEPELRRQLRAARAAEKHAKMKAALAEQQAKEAAEAERRQQQQAHKQAHKERIETWRNKNKGNVRGLLGSLQTVLWEGSGWKPIGMGDLLEPAQVRKAWMKANLLVHPDKVRQRNGGDEQVAIADMIFDALKEAWGQFRN